MESEADDQMCLSGKNKKYVPKKSLPKAHARNLLGTRKIHLIICRRRKASYTLEAVVVLPLCAALWIYILFFFRVLQVEGGVQRALFYAGSKTAAEAAVLSDERALLLSEEILFRKQAAEYPAIDQYVAGGLQGVSLLASDNSGDYVRLRAQYTIRFPVHLFSFQGIAIVQNACARKWTGRMTAGEEAENASDGFIYYTDYGTVYHKSLSCSYLNPSIQPADVHLITLLRNRDGHIYYPCESCHADQVSSGTVYYTNYGTSYHAGISCSGLKRTVHVLPEAEAKGKAYCSKCGG